MELPELYALTSRPSILANSRDITTSQMEDMYSALVAAVNGKSWVGKEAVLQSFVQFMIATKSQLGNVRIGEIQKVRIPVLCSLSQRNMPIAVCLAPCYMG